MSKDLDLVGLHTAGDYGSEFEYDSEIDRARARRQDLATRPPPEKHKLAGKRQVTEEYDKEEGRKMRYHILSMDAYTRHKKFINDYLLYFGGNKTEFKRDTSRDKTDLDVIHENHRFLWTDGDASQDTWEKRLSKKYHDKLFKEYCITDLSRYKENKIALRWRVEKEVVHGKGQFECGDKHCTEQTDLKTWEVNFGYMEHGEKRNALVKLRLCPDCSYKLNYHHRRKEVTQPRPDQTKETTGHKRLKTDTDTDDDKPSVSTGDNPDETSPSDPSQSTEPATQTGTDTGNVWKGPAKVTDDKSRDEEFEDYFEDMFL